MRVSRWIPWAAALLLVSALFWSWPWLRPAFSGGVRAAADLLSRTGTFGPAVVVLLQMLQAIISPLPSWPVTVAAGALYGPAAGTVYSLAGGTLGAAINFWLARHFGQPLVRRRLGEAWIGRAARLRPQHFLVLALLGRLIPVASFDVVAYVAGISQIRLPVFLGVAAVGQAPAFFAYALFGDDLVRAQSAGFWSSLLVLLFAALIVGGRQVWRKFIG